MSLDVYLYATEMHTCSRCGHEDRVSSGGCVYDSNITHNLGSMAEAAGIYHALWRPDELFVKPRASDLIPLLRIGLAKLKADPSGFERHNAPNGWGLYKHFVPFVEKYLAACEENPTALVEVSR